MKIRKSFMSSKTEGITVLENAKQLAGRNTNQTAQSEYP